MPPSGAGSFGAGFAPLAPDVTGSPNLSAHGRSRAVNLRVPEPGPLQPSWSRTRNSPLCFQVEITDAVCPDAEPALLQFRASKAPPERRPRQPLAEQKSSRSSSYRPFAPRSQERPEFRPQARTLSPAAVQKP